MATPLLRLLKDAHPGCAIDVLVARRGTADILEANPNVRRILHADPKPAFPAWLQTVRHLRRGRYDVGIIAHPGQLITSASLLFFGGVRRRIGHRYSWQRLRQSGVFLTNAIIPNEHHALPLADRSTHDVTQNLALLQPLGITTDPSSVRYDLPLAQEDRQHAAAWIKEHRLEGVPLIGFHPGSAPDLGCKRWPAERWSELGDRLSEEYGATVLIFGGPDEEFIPTEVCARMKAPGMQVQLPLRSAAALMTSCLLFVSNDSGLMHTASSQNVPTFGLFGPTDERRTAPWGSAAHVIRAPGTQPTYDVARLRRISDHSQTDPTLLELTVEQVLQEISARIPQPSRP